MDRADVIEALWEQAEPNVYITREQFVRSLDDWTIDWAMHDGRLAFAAMTRGPEYHFTSFWSGAPIGLRLIRSQLAPILERHGHVITRTPREGADRQHRFNLAFGFKVTGEDEHFIHYRLEPKCQ